MSDYFMTICVHYNERQTHFPQSVFSGPGVSTSFGNWLECLIFQHQPRPIESEALGVEPAVWFNKPPVI